VRRTLYSPKPLGIVVSIAERVAGERVGKHSSNWTKVVDEGQQTGYGLPYPRCRFTEDDIMIVVSNFNRS